jgi:hypothetical protein
MPAFPSICAHTFALRPPSPARSHRAPLHGVSMIDAWSNAPPCRRIAISLRSISAPSNMLIARDGAILRGAARSRSRLSKWRQSKWSLDSVRLPSLPPTVAPAIRSLPAKVVRRSHAIPLYRKRSHAAFLSSYPPPPLPRIARWPLRPRPSGEALFHCFRLSPSRGEL